MSILGLNASVQKIQTANVSSLANPDTFVPYSITLTYEAIIVSVSTGYSSSGPTTIFGIPLYSSEILYNLSDPTSYTHSYMQDQPAKIPSKEHDDEGFYGTKLLLRVVVDNEYVVQSVELHKPRESWLTSLLIDIFLTEVLGPYARLVNSAIGSAYTSDNYFSLVYQKSFDNFLNGGFFIENNLPTNSNLMYLGAPLAYQDKESGDYTVMTDSAIYTLPYPPYLRIFYDYNSHSTIVMISDFDSSGTYAAMLSLDDYGYTTLYESDTFFHDNSCGFFQGQVADFWFFNSLQSLQQILYCKNSEPTEMLTYTLPENYSCIGIGSGFIFVYQYKDRAIHLRRILFDGTDFVLGETQIIDADWSASGMTDAQLSNPANFNNNSSSGQYFGLVLILAQDNQTRLMVMSPNNNTPYLYIYDVGFEVKIPQYYISAVNIALSSNCPSCTDDEVL